jgi:VWFA-related protein
VSTWIARLTLAALGATVVFGQQPPPPPQPPGGTQQQQPPIFRAGVRLVLVDVTATGKDDQPVADLQATDFDVTEDGVPQKVDQLQFIRLNGKRPSGDESGLEIRSQEHAEAEAAREDVRLFAIFLDDYHIDKAPSITIPLRAGLSAFINRLWPSDLVVMMDPLTPLSGLRFTRSKPTMLRVVQEFEGRQGEIFPIKSILEEAQLSRGDIRAVRAEVTLSALAALTVRLAGMSEGRKTILFVSQGPPTQFGSSYGNLQDRMREISQAANRGNVTIYTLDPRGLDMESRLGVRDTLYQLSAETGGRPIINTNNVAAMLGRMLAETSAYYMLGYNSTRVEEDGKFHKISVKVKRSGVRVLARQGYWAPSARETEAAAAAANPVREPGVTRALDTLKLAEPTKRKASIWTGWTLGDDGRTRLTMAWDPADPERVPAVATLDVEVLPVGGGAPIMPVRTVHPTVPGTVVRVSELTSLTPGNVVLHLVARAADGVVEDDWLQPLTVPDLATPAIALSTPRAYRAPSLPAWRALRAEPEPQPVAVWQFRRSDRVLVAVDVYARGNETPTVEARVLSRDGRELTALPLPPLEGRRLRFELPVSSFGQGTYLLRVRARIGAESTEQLTGFRVMP